MLDINLIRKQINMINPGGKFNEPTVQKIIHEAERHARETDKGSDPRIHDIEAILTDTLAIIKASRLREEII